MPDNEKVFDDLHAFTFGEVKAARAEVDELKAYIETIIKDSSEPVKSRLLNGLMNIDARLERVMDALISHDFNLE